MKRVLQIVFFLVSFAQAQAFASPKTLRTQVGTNTFYDYDSKLVTNQRYSLRQEASSLVYKKSYGLSLFSNIVVTWDNEEKFLANNRYYQIKADSLYAEWQKGFLRISAGMQQLTWGETFGQPIVDVVNPLDFSQPFTSDLSAIKMAVPLAGAEIIAGEFYAQGLYSPLSLRSPSPRSINGVAVAQPEDFQFFSDAEYGGRLGYLFGFGLDVKGLYYVHNSRVPRYQLELNQATGQPELVLVEAKQQSFGLSASQAFDTLVFRVDTVFENGFLLRNEIQNMAPEEALMQKVQVSQRHQTIAAVDYSSDEGDNYGLQYQTMGYAELPESEMGYHPQLHWAGARASWNFLDGKLSFDLFGIRGINNGDLWVSALTRVYLYSRVELNFEGNLLRSNQNGNKDLFQDRTLANAGVAYKF